jgi:two-component sensor histidine kinase
VLIALLGVSAWASMLLMREEQAQKQLALALDRNRLLMKDIHHRVKNNMQIVSALVHLQPAPAEIKREMTRRLSAMAALHQQIYQSDDMETIDLAAYLRGLVEELKGSYGSQATIVYDLEPFHADRDLALPLALMTSEAMSNAFKYAFPAGVAGTIKVTLRRTENGATMLRVQDDGVGFDPASQVPSLGTRLIEAFAKQIGGAYTLTSHGGTTFTLTFPRR